MKDNILELEDSYKKIKNLAPELVETIQQIETNNFLNILPADFNNIEKWALSNLVKYKSLFKTPTGGIVPVDDLTFARTALVIITFPLGEKLKFKNNELYFSRSESELN